MDKQWHILRVGVGQEAEIVSRFATASYEVYSPLKVIKLFNRKYRAWRKREVSLFPGYLFACVDHPRHVPRSAMIGVRGFMRNGDASYAVVNAREMEAVRLLERSLSFPETLSFKHPFKVGDAVKLEDDTLDALSAVVSRLKGETDVELEVNIMGGIVKMTTQAERLRAA